MSKLVIAFVLACSFAASAFGQIVFHSENRASFTSDVPLARYEPGLPLYGTRIWSVPFNVDTGSYLLSTSGFTIIKHMGVPITGYGASGKQYAIYANCRIALFSGDAAADLPSVGTIPPAASIQALFGTNIDGHSAHYALIPTAMQRTITAGFYRIELWCSAGTDAWDVDGLGGLGYYASDLIHQFNVKVERLP